VANCFLVGVIPDSNPAFPSGSFLFNTPVRFREEDGSDRDSVRFDVILPSGPVLRD
jgi:hypothetical protein